MPKFIDRLAARVFFASIRVLSVPVEITFIIR